MRITVLSPVEPEPQLIRAIN